MKLIHKLIVGFSIFIHLSVSAVFAQTLPGGDDKWQIFWNDEFSYPDVILENNWISANDSTQSNILCARIRRNAVVSGGTLKLINKKETVGTKAWTSGSVWTKSMFQYGYFECRYKYAAATGTNNSFWFMSQTTPAVGKKFEIDINEGHYPSDMATNIHNWTDVTTSSMIYTFSGNNLGTTFHTYGLKWNADSLIFYFDRKPVRKVHNDFCLSQAPVFLSEAIITWAGAVTDAINGTQMEIDYVRVYKPVDPALPYDFVSNGGFETLINNLPVSWDLNRADLLNSNFAYVTTDPAAGTRSLRIKNLQNLSNDFCTNIAQKIPLASDGLYEIRLKARSTLSNAGANKISLKLKDEWTGTTNLMNGDSTIDFYPAAVWQSYRFRLNLKENYDNRLYIGVSKYGYYDIDSISIVRIGNPVSALPLAVQPDNANVTVCGQSVRITSESAGQLQIFSIDGRILYTDNFPVGTNVVNLNAKGVFIVRLRNSSGVFSKKIVTDGP